MLLVDDRPTGLRTTFVRKMVAVMLTHLTVLSPLPPLVCLIDQLPDPTTDDFNDFRGIDLVPESKAEWKKNAKWGGPTYTFSDAPYQILMSECLFAEDEDGEEEIGGWRVQKFGPLVSTGGYDWFQLGWENLFRTDELLAEYPEGIFMTQQISTPITSRGERLGHPPIHTHHVHITGQPGVRQKTDPLLCSIYNVSCYDPRPVSFLSSGFVIHGCSCAKHPINLASFHVYSPTTRHTSFPHAIFSSCSSMNRWVSIMVTTSHSTSMGV